MDIYMVIGEADDASFPVADQPSLCRCSTSRRHWPWCGECPEVSLTVQPSCMPWAEPALLDRPRRIG